MGFNHTGNFTCVCGKTFTNSQAFNGHKANCKEHHMKKYGNLNKLQQSINIAQVNSNKSKKVKAELRKKKKLADWISEQHTCERCGKVMTEYYGSGRFCSQSCARSFSTSVNREQIIEKICKGTNNYFISIGKSRTTLPEKYCTNCNTVLDYRNNSGYCKSCIRKLQFSDETKLKLSEAAKKRNLGGFNFRNKGIYYKNIKLDSTYEVLVAKSLDANNIIWERPKRLHYKDKFGKHRTYTPDFYLPDYDIYLDPKNDFLINNINPNLGYCDCDKIKWVEEQNNVRIIILNKNQLDWTIIKSLI